MSTITEFNTTLQPEVWIVYLQQIETIYRDI